MVELGAAVLEQLGLQAGDLVRVGTAFGEGIFSCRLADLPHNLAFVPYGPEANRLTDARTNGSGMPGYKGLQAWVGRDSVVVHKNVVCPGCGSLCDDLKLQWRKTK